MTDLFYSIKASFYRRVCCTIFFVLQMMNGISVSAQENLHGLKTSTSASRDTTAIMKLINNGFSLRDGQIDSAITLMHKAWNLSRSSGYTDGAGMSLFGLGLMYSEVNKNDTAYKLYLQALHYLKKSFNYRHMLPATYSNLGYMFYFKGDYTKAINYYDSAIQTGNKLNSKDAKKYVAITLNSVSAIHMRLGRAETALRYLEQMEQIAKENNFTNELAIALSNKADVYMEMGQLEKSDQYYFKALQMYPDDKSIEATSLIATIKSGYATLKLRQNKAKEAIQLLKEVEQQNSKYRRENTAIVPALTMGAAYLRLKDYKNAESYLLRALHEAIALDVSDNRDDIHEGLAELYERTGNHKKALYHFRLYEQLKDSLLSKEKARDIGEIDARYRTAEKDKDIAQKQLQISLQQNKLNRQQFWITGISAGALLLGLLFIVLYRLNRQQQKNQAKQIHILEQQQVLQQQQQEINHLNDIVQGEERERVRIARELHDGIVSQLMGVRLHFKGALQYAGDQLANKEDFENTLHYLDETTKELRKTAHNLMPETVLQGGLIMALQTFCEKMAVASGIKIYFQQFGASMPRDADVELSIYRIVQELVQNAIKHAHCSQILVEMNIEDNLLSIDVEDNGSGIADDVLESSNGMGLKSILTRVRSLQGSIDISGKTGKGTMINMEFTV